MCLKVTAEYKSEVREKKIIEPAVKCFAKTDLTLTQPKLDIEEATTRKENMIQVTLSDSNYSNAKSQLEWDDERAAKFAAAEEEEKKKKKKKKKEEVNPLLR
jgi:hypothetical protein